MGLIGNNGAGAMSHPAWQVADPRHGMSATIAGSRLGKVLLKINLTRLVGDTLLASLQRDQIILPLGLLINHRHNTAFCV